MAKREITLRIAQHNSDRVRCRIEYHTDGLFVKFREVSYRNHVGKELDSHLYDDLHMSARDALRHWLDEVPLF